MELGGLRMGRRMRRVMIELRARRQVIRRGLLLFAAGSLLLLAKLAALNVDHVVSRVDAASETLTLEEATYRPFALAVDKAPVRPALTGASAGAEPCCPEFPLKTAAVNRKMQSLNLRVAATQAGGFLRAKGHRCVHARLLGAEFNIVFLAAADPADPAEAIVNPRVARVSDVFRTERVESVFGTADWARLPTWLELDHVDEDLAERTGRRFEWADASCLWYYIQEQKRWQRLK